jgi:hypothetical protein
MSGRVLQERNSMMRDWFSGEAVYVPAWILAGTIMGLWAAAQVNVYAAIAWLLVGGIISAIAWRAAARQVRQGREIAQNLAKLVSVTETSPTNILAAAAAKILALEYSITELSGQLESLRTREWGRLTESQKDELAERLKKIGSHPVWVIRPNTADCIRFAKDFDETFRRGSWHLPESEPYSPGEEKAGIRIQGTLGPASEQLQTAIQEVTQLPVLLSRTTDSREYDGKPVIVLSIGPKGD